MRFQRRPLARAQTQTDTWRRSKASTRFLDWEIPLRVVWLAAGGTERALDRRSVHVHVASLTGHSGGSMRDTPETLRRISRGTWSMQDAELCRTSLTIARNSSCPSSAWTTRIAPLLNAPKMTLVNVGANKGYAVNAFLQRYQRGYDTNSTQWRRQVAYQACGKCLACDDPEVQQARYNKADVRVVAVELFRKNAAQLRRLFHHFNVPGEVLHAAGGETVGTVFEPTEKDTECGLFRQTALSCTGNEKMAIATRGTPVPMVTVDSLVTQYGIDRIDLLSVDTEGHDAAVLLGAEANLASKRVRVVEFEYHSMGRWRNESLHNVISRLKSHGYECFWQSNIGQLSPFLVSCSYEFKDWSNVLCSCEQPIVDAFHSLVPRALQGAPWL